MSRLAVVSLCALFVIITVIMGYILMKRQLDICEYTGFEEYDIMEFFEQEPQVPRSKIAIATLMRKPIDLPIWLKHHRKMGITTFFIRLEDSPSWEEYLASQEDVVFEISNSDKSGNNYETLMYRQLDFVNKTLEQAKKMKINWLFHIDADELLHGQLNFIDDLHDKYKCLRLENAEAVFKEDDNTCFSAVKFLKCGKNAPCKSYVNGKGAGRIEDGVMLAGPHHFSFNKQIQGDNVYEIPFDILHVLHFDSCSLGVWIEKFKHLSKNAKDNVPFPYYRESIDAAVKAFNVYKEHNIKDLKDIDDELVYNINEPLS
jgi:hypothetical protein